MQITFETPEDPAEKRLTQKELCLALGATPKFKAPPDVKRVHRWLDLHPYPMPSKVHPGTGKKGRTCRSFLLSHVLAWLDDPAAYYGKRRKAS